MEMDRCRDLREHLVAWMAGTASKDIELRVELHLSEGCGSCARELEALHASFHAVPLASPPQPMPDGSVPLLARRIAAQPQAIREVPILYPETDGRKLAWVLVFLFGVALVAAAVWGRHQVRQADLAASRVAFEEARARQASGDFHTLRSRAERIEAHLTALTDPRVSSHDFPPGQDGARLRAFLRPERGMLVLSFADFPAPGPGQQQVIWWGQGDAWTQIGLVPVDRVGGITYPLPEGAALPARLQVSTETPSGPPPVRPTGEIVLTGELVAGQPWAAPEALP